MPEKKLKVFVLFKRNIRYMLIKDSDAGGA